MPIREESLAENRCIVSVDGRLDQSQTSELETSLHKLLEDGCIELIVDLSGTDYINSGGLRCLVSAWRKAHQQDGDLLLCGLNQKINEIFEMVGFDQVFKIFSTRTEAQNAFS